MYGYMHVYMQMCICICKGSYIMGICVWITGYVLYVGTIYIYIYICIVEVCMCICMCNTVYMYMEVYICIYVTGNLHNQRMCIIYPEIFRVDAYSLIHSGNVYIP